MFLECIQFEACNSNNDIPVFSIVNFHTFCYCLFTERTNEMYDIRSQDNYEPIWHYVKHIEKRISNPLTRAYSLRLGMRDNVFQYLRSELQNGTISISWNDMIDGAQDAEWLQSLFHRKKYLVGSGTWNDNPYGFEVDQEGFVKIYTDGACLGNGKPGAKAGIGVYFNDHHTL